MTEPSESMDWQPIETAPKDGRLVLLWLRAPYSTADVLRWEPNIAGWVSEHWELQDEGFCGSLVPSHWMPLPPPMEPLKVGQDGTLRIPAELKPCPFCGGEARCVDLAGWEIHCDCGAQLWRARPDKEALVEHWNVRIDGVTDSTAAAVDAPPGGWVARLHLLIDQYGDVAGTDSEAALRVRTAINEAIRELRAGTPESAERYSWAPNGMVRDPQGSWVLARATDGVAAAPPEPSWWAAALNRRATVEQLMFDAARGKRPMPTADELRAWALKLGTPDQGEPHGAKTCADPDCAPHNRCTSCLKRWTAEAEAGTASVTGTSAPVADHALPATPVVDHASPFGVDLPDGSQR